MIPSEKSQEIANKFSKYVRTGDKSLIKNCKFEEIELAILQYNADRGWPHYKAMENRIEELKTLKNKGAKINQQDLLVEFKKITSWWTQIEEEFGITKNKFGRKINFVKAGFKREIIFRDVEHAYALSKIGFSKPAAIIAGSVIEELLRLFLEHKKITVGDSTFSEYIKACEREGVLKAAVHSLTTSVRHFRNLVHLKKEAKKKDTISRATAAGAVASIFTLVNDF